MTIFKEEYFSDKSYIEIIKSIKEYGYEFIKFTSDNELKKHKKNVILRHDVDISPEGALKLGKIEKEHGVVSNFFFQLNAGTYQMLSEYCVDICKELQSMGHLVGLHVDNALFSEEEQKIKHTIDWIRDNLIPIDNVISFHRPSNFTLGKKYNSFISAYEKDFFNKIHFASDSRGECMFYKKLEGFFRQEVNFFQLLLHPCWWENETDRFRIYELASKRKQKELDNYMLANFPKVFGHVISSRGE